MSQLDPIHRNRDAWDEIARGGKRWFQPASSRQISEARAGNGSICVTATKPVPREWLENLRARSVLCLGGGGGLQGPVLAAAGACVTVSDISPEQLAIDDRVAMEHSLEVSTVEADMQSMPMFADQSFDLIVNPCSVNYVPNVRAVWQECARVLRPGGILIAGLLNPVHFLFDAGSAERNRLVVANSIPCKLELDPQSNQVPVEFGHSLEDLLGELLRAGFGLTGLMEDRWGGKDFLSNRIAVFLAIRAVRNGAGTFPAQCPAV